MSTSLLANKVPLAREKEPREGRWAGMLTPYLLASLVAVSVTGSSEPSSAVSQETQTSGVQGADAPVSAPESAPPSVTDVPQIQALLKSCNHALGEGSCVSAMSESGAPWRASVNFSDEGVKVTLQTTTESIERDILFSEGDSPEQRRVAAGLLVAAMAAAAHLAERERIDGAPPPTTKKVDPVSDPLSQVAPNKGAARRRAGYELAALASPFLGSNDWGAGGLARFTFWPSSAGGISADARFLYGTTDDLSAYSFQGAAGLVFSFWSEHRLVSLRVHPEAVLDVTRVFQVAGSAESRVATRGGGRLGLSLAAGQGRLKPWLGAAVTALAPSMEIRLDGQLLQAVPPVTLSFSLGLRWEP